MEPEETLNTPSSSVSPRRSLCALTLIEAPALRDLLWFPPHRPSGSITVRTLQSGSSWERGVPVVSQGRSWGCITWASSLLLFPSSPSLCQVLSKHLSLLLIPLLRESPSLLPRGTSPSSLLGVSAHSLSDSHLILPAARRLIFPKRNSAIASVAPASQLPARLAWRQHIFPSCPLCTAPSRARLSSLPPLPHSELCRPLHHSMRVFKFILLFHLQMPHSLQIPPHEPPAP